VNAAATALVRSQGKDKGNNALFAAIEPGRDRFAKRYQAAVASGDGEERDRLDIFRSDVTAFVNGYDFLSQIIDFGDVEIEKLAIYARGLARLIRDEVIRTPIDLTGVELVGYSIKPQDEHELGLTGESELPPAKLGNTKTPVDPKLAALWEAIEQLNTLFDEDWGTDVDAKAFVEHVSGKVGEDEQIAAQRAANSEEQFLASPNLKQAVVTGLVQSQENAGGMTNELFGDQQKLGRFVEIIGRFLYRNRDAA
jgi:type I restriction enzyme R subunit